MSDWTAGARSISTLAGNGWCSFVVPVGSIGVRCGFNDVDTNALTELEHGFFIESGQYRVIENGTPKTSLAAFSNGTLFSVARHNGTVYYCVGTTKTFVVGVPFLLPGSIVYTSANLSVGDVFLDSAFFHALDEITEASIVTEADALLTHAANGADIRLLGMGLIAQPSDYAYASMSLLQMGLGISGGHSADVAVSFRQMGVFAQSTPINICNISFLPMIGEASEYNLAPSYVGVSASMYPMSVDSLGGYVLAGMTATAHMPPMGCYTSSTPISSVNAHFPRQALSLHGQHSAAGATFTVRLPAMMGISAENYAKESAVITSRAQYRVFSDFRETAVFNDYATSIVTVKRDLREKAKLADRDYATARSTQDVTDTAVLDDQTTLYNYRTDVRETAPISSEATGVSISRRDVRETFTGRDWADTASPYKVRDTAVLNDSATLRTRTVQDVRDTAALNDSYDDVVSGVETVREVAVLNDHATNISTTRVVVRERGFISDAVTLISMGEVWTANVKNWAMSRYENFPLESFNDNYALGEDGIFAPSGLYADGHFTTGITRLGASIKKTVSNLYFYGERETPLEVEVTADVRGLRQTYSYTQMARSADDSRMVRCDLGKGFSSTNYQFTVSGSGAFTVEHIEPVIQAGSRRI